MTYWTQVSDRLVTLFTSVAPEGVVVFEGQRNNNGGRDYICVGADEDGDAGSISFERSELGNTFLAETGTVSCLIVAQSGTDLKASRDRAFSLAQALSAAIAADHTLGLLPHGSVTSAEAQVRASVGERGVAQVLTFQVTYTTPF